MKIQEIYKIKIESKLGDKEYRFFRTSIQIWHYMWFSEYLSRFGFKAIEIASKNVYFMDGQGYCALLSVILDLNLVMHMHFVTANVDGD